MRGVQERRVVVTPLSVRERLRARQLVIPAVAAIVLAADQASKTWALHHVPLAPGGRHVIGPVWLVLTLNGGAAFSVGRGVTPVIEGVVVVLVVWLLVFSRRASRAASLPMAVGLGLLIGGAAGNLSGSGVPPQPWRRHRFHRPGPHRESGLVARLQRG